MIFRKKLKVGIDINEVLRARWSNFDRFFVQEFGEDNLPEQPYVFDFFKSYPWKDTTETIKVLKEPEDMPNDINPIDYKVDSFSNEAPADFALFKAPETKTLTAKEVYNRFMYEDFVFEIFASSPVMYRGMDLDVKNFYEKYKNSVEFVILSVENQFSIPSTLSFLAKMTSRFSNYKFVDNAQDMWKHCDILITSDPEILNNKKPWGKKLIKIKRPYNDEIKTNSLEILQINDLTKNVEFQKTIKY